LAREKVYPSPAAALFDVFDGAVVLVSGFAGVGRPVVLLQALKTSGVGGLTLVCTHGSWARTPTRVPSPPDAPSDGIEELVANGQVSKIISPLPFAPDYEPVDGPVNRGVVAERWAAGQLEIEIIPQSILAEQLRCAGAGLGGVFLPDAVGTRYAGGKESQTFDGQPTVLELPLKADFALIKAQAGDTLGNLVYDGTDRNWGPVFAMAGSVAIAEVLQLHEPGGLDPELVITPGIFVNRIIQGW
jgi:3-oxoadipate CoA-transferase alpha subunit